MTPQQFVLCLATLLFVVAAEPLRAEDPKLTLGDRGNALLKEDFAAAKLPDGWTRNTGKLDVADGVLRCSEVATDKHAAAFRYRLALQDCAVQFDFQLGEAKLLHCGFDPTPGELKKKGHLFSVAITPNSWSIVEHPDKNNPQSKTKVMATGPVKFDPSTWYTLVVECRGDEVVAQLTGHAPLRGQSADFHVKKPGLVFRVGGQDDQAVRFDNLRVWVIK